ncbi:hypothetical protein B0A48_04721 [Cryoendolithus antarcticus]|uniref:UPF3 domain-containing protein n=1 Tax=Cryoendolithus antarcticus TaxID=1507870 RepID=A0A1V8TD75_9PEZI|nr:hypothetical protein B0A48_04721 [Cryoendolithus antarcticus]
MPPKVLQKAANDQQSGVLSIPAAARTQASPQKSNARLKLEVRRLPPSLTLTEFEEILGEDWKLGAGKIDWREYRQGKIKSPGKLPEQSRCYVHLVNESLVRDFEQRFLDVVFHDKSSTHKLPELKHLPPTLGFAPNQRVPLPGKQKPDTRQGTIDQDAEFIAFLEAETQPIAKPAPVDVTTVEKEPKAKSTPLIEALRERKAAKAKAAAAKSDAKTPGKTDAKDSAAETQKMSPAVPTPKKGEKGRLEQITKDVAKVANKQANGKQAQNGTSASPASPQRGVAPPVKGKRVAPPQSPKAAATAPTVPANAPPTRTAPAQRQRGNAEGIKKMLQKDLGIKPKPVAPATSAATTPTPPITNPATITPKPTITPTQQPSPQQPTPPALLPKAYLKHANPSQGMTEILIQRALAVFEASPATMGNVTIDPRKGTAIAVFRTQEGLRKALEAKRVSVGRGEVEVLRLREGVPGGAPQGGGGGGRGGFRGPRGGGGARGVRGGAGVAVQGAGGPAAAVAPAVKTPAAGAATST